MVIEAARKHGVSLTGFAGIIEVSRESVYKWMTQHREFADAVSRAKPVRTLWWELKLGRSRKGAETMASIFALKNVQPDEWRDVKYQQHQHMHQIKQLTDAELNAIAAGQVAEIGDGVIDGTCEHVEVQQPNERKDVAE
jgi:transposase-like protein